MFTSIFTNDIFGCQNPKQHRWMLLLTVYTYDVWRKKYAISIDSLALCVAQTSLTQKCEILFRIQINSLYYSTRANANRKHLPIFRVRVPLQFQLISDTETLAYAFPAHAHFCIGRIRRFIQQYNYIEIHLDLLKFIVAFIAIRAWHFCDRRNNNYNWVYKRDGPCSHQIRYLM